MDRDGRSSLLSLVKAFDSVLAVYEGFCNLKQVFLSSPSPSVSLFQLPRDLSAEETEDWTTKFNHALSSTYFDS